MSQRVRAHTTGATPTPKPSKAPKSAKTQKATNASEKTPTQDTDVSDGSERNLSAAGASDLTATDQRTSNDDAPVMAAPTLARVLRAVAQELERDPSLAQRVAASMASPDAPVSTCAPEMTSIQAQPSTTSTTPTTGAISAPADDAPVAAEPEAPVTHSGERVNRTFHPRIVTGAPPELGPGVPDPFALYERLGEAGLRAALDELRLGSLRAIVRERHLDPSGRLAKQNDAAKLRALIIGAVVGHE